MTDLEAQIATATANEAQVTQKLSGQVNGEQASVAAARAQVATAKAQVDAEPRGLGNAQWNLDQTSVYAPASGYVINVQLRPGSFVAAFPFAPAMSFVEETYQVIALYAQNELRLVEPGNEAEFALNDVPRANHQGEGRFDRLGARAGPGPQSGTLPQTSTYLRLRDVPGEVRGRRARPRALSRRRRGGRTARSTPNMRMRFTSSAW